MFTRTGIVKISSPSPSCHFCAADLAAAGEAAAEEEAAAALVVVLLRLGQLVLLCAVELHSLHTCFLLHGWNEQPRNEFQPPHTSSLLVFLPPPALVRWRVLVDDGARLLCAVALASAIELSVS